jgi:amidase
MPETVRLAAQRTEQYSGATAAMNAMVSGETTARKLLEDCLEAIDQDNDTVNAVVHMDIDSARKLADERDQLCQSGNLIGPLHGLPVTIKECFDVEDMPTTWGDPKRAHSYPTKSSGVAERLRAAGAVLLGKTNIPANLGDWETDNPLFGGTRNPHDLSKSAGGSSGGSAAAVACGFSYADIGSDQGGSIRLPANYCGVHGLKPSWDILPMSGHSMTTENRVPDIGVSGPIVRRSEDISLLIEALSGPNVSKTAWRLFLPPNQVQTLTGLRVAVMLEHPECPIDHPYYEALQSMAQSLEEADVLVDRIARPAIDFNAANDLMNLLVRAETATRMSDEEYIQRLHIAQNNSGKIERFKRLNARGCSLPHREWLMLHEERIEVCNQWAEFFNVYDFFLCPVSASAASPFRPSMNVEKRTVPVNGAEIPVLAQHFWFSFASLAYLPANSAPIGKTSQGLPCGVQVIGRRYHDHDVAAFSGLLQDTMASNDL